MDKAHWIWLNMNLLQNNAGEGAWVAQSITLQTSVQVMISRFMGSGPESGSVLRAQSLEPASESVSLSAPPLLMLMLCLSKINIKQFFKIVQGREGS